LALDLHREAVDRVFDFRRRIGIEVAEAAAEDSNTRIGSDPLRSSSAGIFEFGFTATKPLPNCSPSWMRISQASYSAPR
jgi:hypothetical protein